MKVISVMQPFATLIVMGAKRIETRPRDTKYRGEILIHASKGKDYMHLIDKLPFLEFIHKSVKDESTGMETLYPCAECFSFGAIIGKVNLISTIETEVVSGINSKGVSHSSGKNWEFSKQEKAFGDYSPGRYGYLLSDPVLFKDPIPAKGQLGLWNYDFEPSKLFLP